MKTKGLRSATNSSDTFRYETTAHNSHTEVLIRVASKEDFNLICRLEAHSWNISQRASEDTLKTRFQLYQKYFFIAENKITHEPYGFLFILPVASFNENDRLVWANYAELATKPLRSQKCDHCYGISMSIVSEAPGGIGTALMKGVAHWCKTHGVKKFAWGGRMSNFRAAHEKGITMEEYFRGVLKGANREELAGVAVNSGARIVRAIENYYDDPDSLDYGLLVVYDLND